MSDAKPQCFPSDKINPEWRKATYVLAGDELLRPRPMLAILLATVENRADLFALLHAELKRQAEGRAVEIIVACDAKQISIGRKRQNLLEEATADYVVFVDDDDWIAPDYVDRILVAITTNPDCVGFKIECTFDGSKTYSAVTSMRYQQWAEDHDGFDYVRPIYHKSVVLRGLALKAGFPDLRYGEDRIFSERVMKLVKTEVFVDAVLYHYRFKSEPFMAKYGILAPKAPLAPGAPRAYGKGVDLSHKRRPFQGPPRKK